MANKSLFSSLKSLFPRATALNDAGGPAYDFEPKHALAQLAATGCFNGTFYADAEKQLATLQSLVSQVNDNVFLAKLAIYSRERAYLPRWRRPWPHETPCSFIRSSIGLSTMDEFCGRCSR